MPPKPPPDPPVAPSRIPVQALPSVAEPQSGMTVTVDPENGIVSAYSRNQKIVWQYKTGRGTVNGVMLVDGNVVLQPGGETLHLPTGKLLLGRMSGLRRQWQKEAAGAGVPATISEVAKEWCVALFAGDTAKALGLSAVPMSWDGKRSWHPATI